jgi:hypothetical protein
MARDLGLTKKTAIKARAGRIYRVTLVGQASRRWLAVRDPYDPTAGCHGSCPFRAAATASALVGASVKSLSGTCVALATLRGPVLNHSFNVTDRRLAQGLVPSGTALAVVGVPTTSGRVYLELRPDSDARCSEARYAVRFSVQRALASGGGHATDSASAAQYDDFSTALARRQDICAHKGKALDKYTTSLSRRIVADLRRRRRRAEIAHLKALIRRATSRFLATPCPPPT